MTLTRTQLSGLLSRVNCSLMARETGLSVRTIYRLRDGECSPRMDTVAAIVAAHNRITKGSTRRPRAKTTTATAQK